MILAAFQLLSLGILGDLLDNSTMTAAVTLATAGGGDPNDFNSVRFICGGQETTDKCKVKLES